MTNTHSTSNWFGLRAVWLETLSTRLAGQLPTKNLFSYRDVRISTNWVSGGSAAYSFGEIRSARFEIVETSARHSRWLTLSLQFAIAIFLLIPAVALSCSGYLEIGFLLLVSGGLGMWRVDQWETFRELNRIHRYNIYLSGAAGEVLLSSWLFSGDYLQKGHEKNQCRRILDLIEKQVGAHQSGPTGVA